MTTDDQAVCENCGVSIPGNAPEKLCPACLMLAALAGSAPGLAQAVAEADAPSTADIAARLPQLQIIELLGRGGMGTVFRARQPNLDRDVAVKVLATSLAKDPDFADRFEREAKALARLAHPNIVAMHEFGTVAGPDDATPLHYMIMEFVDGVTLRHLLRQGLLQPEQALSIVPQICVALQYAHDQGVVHRDIKPENILVDRQGRVKIADFGLAKLTETAGAVAQHLTLTQAAQRVGTPVYMAPEQIETPLTVDHRADIYSLGVVFYEMLTGELPLGRFDLPSQKVSVDVRLDDVVVRALEKKPERRYQHASEVKTDVDTICTSDEPIRRTRPAQWSAALALLLALFLLTSLPLWTGLKIGPITLAEPVGLSGVHFPRVSYSSALYCVILALVALLVGGWSIRKRAPRGAWLAPMIVLLATACAAFVPYRAGPLLGHWIVPGAMGRFEYTPQGMLVMCMSSGSGSALAIVNPTDGRIIRKLHTTLAGSERVAVSPKGDRLVLVGDTPSTCDQVEFFDLSADRTICTLNFKISSNKEFHFSPDGSQVVISVDDRFNDDTHTWVEADYCGLYFYSSADGKLLQHINLGHVSQSGRESLDWVGDTVALTSVLDETNWHMRLWSPSKQKSPPMRFYVNGMAFSIHLSPDGQWLAAAVSNVIATFSMKTGERIHDIDDGSRASDYVESMAFSKDGSWLGAAHNSGRLVIWDFARRSIVRDNAIPGASPGCRILSMRFDPTRNQCAAMTVAGDLWVFQTP